MKNLLILVCLGLFFLYTLFLSTTSGGFSGTATAGTSISYSPIKKCLRDTALLETPCIQQNVSYLSDVLLPDLPFLERRIDVSIRQKDGQ